MGVSEAVGASIPPNRDFMDRFSQFQDKHTHTSAPPAA